MTQQRTQLPTLVQQPDELTQILPRLLDSPQIAIDTESDSLYSYHPRVCLIQITIPAPGAAASAATASRDTDDLADMDLDVVDFLIDPLGVPDLRPLQPVVADPAREIIMHAAENDILLLQRDFDFTFGQMFDTQLAARILGWPRAALAAILEERFGVKSDKRMQRTDWGRRPLSADQIAYAQMDTHYLLALVAQQKAELRAADRWEEAQEAFGFLTQLDFFAREESTRTVWQMKESRAVPREATNVLQALWTWRETEAARRNIPPFKIFTNQVLVDLAQEQPSRVHALRDVKGISEGHLKRYGENLVEAIRQGQRAPLPDLPESTRPDQIPDKDIQARFDALRKWRTATAEARGVAPDIVFNNEALMEMAKRQPQSEAALQEISNIGPWKARTYGPAIFEVLRTTVG
ncbi:MAG: HRDC domain-containing protein [Litorilinea sp.]